MRVVFSPMAVARPPITPARAMAPAASAITRLDASSVYSSSFKRAEMLARFGGADEDGVAFKQIRIEGVHRLRAAPP